VLTFRRHPPAAKPPPCRPTLLYAIVRSNLIQGGFLCGPCDSPPFLYACISHRLLVQTGLNIAEVIFVASFVHGFLLHHPVFLHWAFRVNVPTESHSHPLFRAPDSLQLGAPFFHLSLSLSSLPSVSVFWAPLCPPPALFFLSLLFFFTLDSPPSSSRAFAVLHLYANPIPSCFDFPYPFFSHSHFFFHLRSLFAAVETGILGGVFAPPPPLSPRKISRLPPLPPLPPGSYGSPPQLMLFKTSPLSFLPSIARCV